MSKTGEPTFFVPVERITQSILLIHGQKVMLSTHLAEIYEVEPRALIQAVKRNIERFPEDFMFQLSDGEFANLKSQVVTSSWGGIRRAESYAFTEQDVAMLSSVLRSDRGIRQRVLPGKSQILSGELAAIESFVQRGVAQMMLPFQLSWSPYVFLMGILDAANLKELGYGG